MKDVSGKLKTIGKILLLMYAVTALLLGLAAFLMQRFQLGEKAVAAVIGAVYVLSCFLGGFLAGKVQKSRKFLWGLLMGTVYMLLMLGITLIVKHGISSALPGFFLNLILCTGAGMLGGMLS